MRDRLPQPGKEGRVKITQDNGQVIEGVLGFADGATQAGSTYCKGNVLPDNVCDALGIDRVESEPKDAFAIIGAIPDGYGAVAVRFHATVTGLQTGHIIASGAKQSISNSAGIAMLVLEAGTHTIQVSPTLDSNLVGNATRTVTVNASEVTCTDVSVTHKTDTQVQITSSRAFSLSGRVADFDMFCVGAGGSGCSVAAIDKYSVAALATGGGGGYANTLLNRTNDSQIYLAQIGSGAESVVSTDRSKNGLKGGATKVTIKNVDVIISNGGDGGVGADSSSNYVSMQGANGGSGSSATYDMNSNKSRASGRNGSNGSDAGNDKGGVGQGTTTTAFSENVGTQYAPAGGSTSCTLSAYQGVTEVGTGGSNAVLVFGSVATAKKASTAGAGGGAAIAFNRNGSATATSAAGANGLLIVRWRYKD